MRLLTTAWSAAKTAGSSWAPERSCGKVTASPGARGWRQARGAVRAQNASAGARMQRQGADDRRGGRRGCTATPTTAKTLN